MGTPHMVAVSRMSIFKRNLAPAAKAPQGLFQEVLEKRILTVIFYNSYFSHQAFFAQYQVNQKFQMISCTSQQWKTWRQL